jgi:hypothetical protein
MNSSFMLAPTPSAPPQSHLASALPIPPTLGSFLGACLLSLGEYGSLRSLVLRGVTMEPVASLLVKVVRSL